MARLLGKMRDENLSDGQRYQFENERTSSVLVATASELAAKRKEIEQEQCREVPDSELLTIEIRQADIITSKQANLEQMKSILTNAAANPDGAGVTKRLAEENAKLDQMELGLKQFQVNALARRLATATTDHQRSIRQTLLDGEMQEVNLLRRLAKMRAEIERLRRQVADSRTSASTRAKFARRLAAERLAAVDVRLTLNRQNIAQFESREKRE